MLITKLRIAKYKLPVLNNSNISKEKVEKVLKPPQKPIIIKALIFVESSIFSIDKKIITPKIMVLKKFDANVAKGFIF